MKELLKIKELLNVIKNYQIPADARKETAKCLKRIGSCDNYNIDSRINYLKDNNIRVNYKID